MGGLIFNFAQSYLDLSVVCNDICLFIICSLILFLLVLMRSEIRVVLVVILIYGFVSSGSGVLICFSSFYL